MAKKQTDRYLWARDAQRVQVLGDGGWVRLFDHLGQSHQVPARPGVIAGVLEAISTEDPDCADRIQNELIRAGFTWATDLDLDLTTDLDLK